MKSFNQILFKKKKGMGFSEIAMLIIILSAAILMILVMVKLQENTRDDAVIDNCRLSVLAQAVTEVKLTATGKESPFNLNCQKRYVQIFKDQVKIGYDPDATRAVKVDLNGRKSSKFLTTDFVVNQVIAEEMRICNYQFLEGKKDIWPNNEQIFKSHVCYICSEIRFDKDISQQEFSGFIDYINSTKLKQIDKTYYEYFSIPNENSKMSWEQYQMGRRKLELINVFDAKFQKDQSYMVVFFKEYIAGFKDSYFPIILNEKELNTLCAVQAN